ncbi:tspO/MBR family protein [Corynebacterium simulans]|uniref:tryptophan-rich sensory protein n=1 Tax=Corynebacterium simulans TaxID=146827 RepID=UPI00078BE317|nr:TspO/MBR family protein [Corynebacterium simulans]AMO89874.1 tspO/MBR family protein [Corynebacterium simulans]
MNAGWSGLFFRSKHKRLATAWAGALGASSADLVRRAWKSAPERGALLAPYVAWTGFVTVLSAEIARLNRRH